MNFDFVKREERLSVRESNYWKKVFNANLMNGSEIEFEMANGYVNDIRSALRPNSRITEFNGIGVESVDSDGSLRDGCEIRTSGKRLYGYMEQFSMYKSIVDKLYRFKPIVNGRAGWHNHFVLQNIDGVKAQEMPVPGIILKNVLSICKIFYPALSYITSTMPGDIYTRRNNFCHDMVLQMYNPNNSAETCIREFQSSHNARYNAINLYHLKSSGNNITKFHIEFRFPDCSVFPAQMATVNFMLKAIIIKAIELSKYGVLDTTEENYVKLKKLYLYKNTGFENFSDLHSSNPDIIKNFVPDSYDREGCVLTDKALNAIRSLSKEFYNFIAPTMHSLDKNACMMLKALSEKPVTEMFKEMNTNRIETINEALEEVIDVNVPKTDNSVLDVLEVIEKGLVRCVDSVDDWFNKTSNLVTCKAPMDEVINIIANQVPLGFSNEFGYYVKGDM